MRYSLSVVMFMLFFVFPFAAEAASKTYYFHNQKMGYYVISGHFDYDIDTKLPSNVLVKTKRDEETTYNYGDARVIGDQIILRPNASYAAGDNLVYIDMKGTDADGNLLGNVFLGVCTLVGPVRCDAYRGTVHELLVPIYLTPPPAEVPSMTEWGLLLMTLALASGAGWVIHSRRPVAA